MSLLKKILISVAKPLLRFEDYLRGCIEHK
jgi:hypothetical protein